MKDVTIYTPSGAEAVTVTLSASSTRNVSLMGNDFVTLCFTLQVPYNFTRGHWCEIEDDGLFSPPVRYMVIDPTYPTYDKASGGYVYKLRMDAWYYMWKRYIFAYVPAIGEATTQFGYTDTFINHIGLLMRFLHDKRGVDGARDSSIILPSVIAVHYIEYLNENDDATKDAHIWTTYYNVSNTTAEVRQDNGSIGSATLKEDGMPLMIAADFGKCYMEAIQTVDEGTIDPLSYEALNRVEATYIEDHNGENVDTVVKYINYSNKNVVDTLKDICSEKNFDCEWWIDGRTMHFGRCEKNEAMSMMFPRDFDSCTRSNSSGEYATRVYAFGSERNAPITYRKNLIFQANKTGEMSGSTDDSQAFSFPDFTYGMSLEFPEEIGDDHDYVLTLPPNTETIDIYFEGNILYDNLVIRNEKIGLYIVGRDTPIVEFYGSGRHTCDNTINLEDYAEYVVNNTITFRYSFSATVERFEEDIVMNGYYEGKVYPATFVCHTKKQTATYKYVTDTGRIMIPQWFTSVSRSVDEQSVILPSVNESKYDYRVFKEEWYKSKRDAVCLGYYKHSFVTVNYDITAGNTTIDDGLKIRFYTVRSFDGWTTLEDNSTNIVNECGNFTHNKAEFSYIGNLRYKLTGSDRFEVTFEKQLNTLGADEKVLLFMTIEVESSIHELFGKVSVQSETESATTTMTIYDESMRVIGTADAIINPFNRLVTEKQSSLEDVKSSTYFALVNAADYDKFAVGATSFTLSGVDETEVRPAYFTESEDMMHMAGQMPRLMLPIDKCPHNYVELDTNAKNPTEIVEIVKTFDDIYPTIDLKVVDVKPRKERVEYTADDGSTSYKEITCYNIIIECGEGKFTFNADSIVTGQTLQIQFFSGILAGFTFDVAYGGYEGYSTSSNRQIFKIVNSKSYGTDIPNESLKPRVNDRFTLLNYNGAYLVKMNAVTIAEERLYRRAMSYLDKVSRDHGTYNSVMTSEDANAYYQENGHLPQIGQRIKLTHRGYFKEDISTRVIGCEYKLDIPYDAPKLTIGEAVGFSRFSSIEKKINN